MFVVIVNAPEGASYSYTAEYMTEIERRMMPYVEAGEIKPPPRAHPTLLR